MIKLFIYHPLNQLNNDVDSLSHEIFATLKLPDFVKFLYFESLNVMIFSKTLFI